jgi:hypothetical protein
VELIIIIAVVFVAVWFLLRLAGDVINLAAAIVSIAVWCLVWILAGTEAALKWIARRHAHRRLDPPQ